MSQTFLVAVVIIVPMVIHAVLLVAVLSLMVSAVVMVDAVLLVTAVTVMGSIVIQIQRIVLQYFKQKSFLDVLKRLKINARPTKVDINILETNFLFKIM